MGGEILIKLIKIKYLNLINLIDDQKNKKNNKQKKRSKIICLTAYSKNIAEELDKYTDIVLVGDSLGSVLYNYSTTRKVTLTEMINHSKSVRLE